MSELFFEKYANFDRVNEPVRVSIPFTKGAVRDLTTLRVFKDEKTALSQARALGFWDDGSVKWAKVDFMADLPANNSAVYNYEFSENPIHGFDIAVVTKDDTFQVQNGSFVLDFNNKAGEKPFRCFERGGFKLNQEQIDGPYILDEAGDKYTAVLDEPWTVEEEGVALIKLSAKGRHKSPGGAEFMDFIINVTVYAKTPWFEIQYRVINKTEPEYVHIKKIALDLHFDEKINSTRALATSNYLSSIREADGDEDLYHIIDADYLLYDANEQTAETFYGTYFADWNSREKGGICATLYQAYQNFPKALRVSKRTLSIEILPENATGLKYYRGMAKNHTLFLHLHGGDESVEDINKRSLMLQSMDKPILPARVYDESGCYVNLFPKNRWVTFDAFLLGLADGRGKAYGILNWGDFPDSGYSQQGRGGGEPVWTNNEYDFPYAAMQLFARSGIRRLLDYVLVTGAHWVDIDVIHHHPDPLRHGAQVEHCRDHVTGTVSICHEWVEGLFAYYYQTGDKFAYDTVIGIGENIMRHLDQPRYHNKGGVNARETGWALRALTALYRETNDPKWLKYTDFIVSHFTSWKETYGGWLSPYTDHTVVRVPFMISVAAASLMRYYRVKPDESIKAMIVDAMDDLIENCLLENGQFYYKELPSLQKPGGNPIALEALACAYELTGDEKYLRAGLQTFKLNMKRSGSAPGRKEKIKDGLLLAGNGPKGFAQSFYPLASYFYHISDTKILEELMNNER